MQSSMRPLHRFASRLCSRGQSPWLFLCLRPGQLWGVVKDVLSVSLHGCEVTAKIASQILVVVQDLFRVNESHAFRLDAKSCNIEASSECRRWDLTPSLSGQISCMKRLLSTAVCFLIVLSCLVLSCLVLSCIVLYCIVLYCIVLYCIVLYCIVLYCIVLYCIVLYQHLSLVPWCHVLVVLSQHFVS